MKVVAVIVIFVYLLMAQRLFTLWLKFFSRDREMSPSERRLSWVMLVLGTLFWPIVVPQSYIRLLEQKLNSQEEVSGSQEATEASCESLDLKVGI